MIDKELFLFSLNKSIQINKIRFFFQQKIQLYSIRRSFKKQCNKFFKKKIKAVNIFLKYLTFISFYYSKCAQIRMKYIHKWNILSFGS